ncbi:MAG: argininosuccinate lyase [Spirochaetaceae bacterium]
MARLWDKGAALDERIARFTVGEDYILDRRLVPADCVAGIAHVRGLRAAEILNENEGGRLEAALRSVIADHAAGGFTVSAGDEDGHTAVENRLVAELGEVGKKVHTGRSRNDQVAVALRLYGRRALDRVAETALDLVETLLGRAAEEETTVMNGRTHMQPAMLSTFGLWLGAVAEELIDDLGRLEAAYDLLDQCPLGAAASYGVPLPLDRELTSRLLGFSRVHNNVLYAVSSRGKMESVVLDALSQVGLTLGRAAADLIFFSLPEIGYVSLPESLCTGSSIMPQKKNPDVLELVRGKTAALSGVADQVRNVVRALPAGYNRDVQETKGPFMRGLDTARACIEATDAVVSGLEVHREVMRRAIPTEVYATDAALDLVAEGVPFREAYRRIGGNPELVTAPDPQEALGRRNAVGSPGNLNLEAPRRRAVELRERLETRQRRLSEAVRDLVGSAVELAPDPAPHDGM